MVSQLVAILLIESLTSVTTWCIAAASGKEVRPQRSVAVMLLTVCSEQLCTPKALALLHTVVSFVW